MGVHSLSQRTQRGRLALVGLSVALVCTVGTINAISSQAATTASAVDDFTRAVASGLGNADTGGPYTLSYPSGNPFSVSGGAARIKSLTPGASVRASLMQTRMLDTDVKTTVGVPAVGFTSVGLYHAVEARLQGDGSAYRGRVTIGAAGKLAVGISRANKSAETVLGTQNLASSITALQSLNVELAVIGASPVRLQVRAWVGGQPRPDWQLTYVDSSATRISSAGAVGTWDYLSSSAAPTSLAISYFTASPLAASSASSSGPSPSSVSATTTTNPSAPMPPGVTPPAATPGSAGSIAVGAANYPIPSGSLFVSSSSGDDAAVGTVNAPLKTVTSAVKKATTGQTVVLRGGSYHETLGVDKRVVIQNYPGEVVWFDGSSLVSGLKRVGSTWSVGGWTTQFDSSPSYSRGAAPSNQPYWGFINAAHPMAAHPDQVWIDGVAQAQVGTLAAVKSGTFFVDYGGAKLFLGSDPTGHVVRASDLATAMTLTAAGTVIRGIGVTRFAPSVPDMGAVRVNGPGTSLENMVLSDNATTGVSVQATNVNLTRITSIRNGLLGVHVNYADGLRVAQLDASDNNKEHFNLAPVSGGMKVTRTRNVSVYDSVFDNNDGPGLWFDESSYDVDIVANIMTSNTSYGVAAEISANFRILNNLIMKNVGNGITIKNTNGAQIWNNTILGNARPISITQDTRVATSLSTPGHDPRQKLPDPAVTWMTGSDRVSNNVISGSTGNCLLCLEDWTHSRSAAQMGVTASGNVYQRTSLTAPNSLVIWARQGTDPAVYRTLAAFQGATGQDPASVELASGSNAGTSNGLPSSAVESLSSSVAIALPSDIAGFLGQATGTKHLGSWVSLN